MSVLNACVNLHRARLKEGITVAAIRQALNHVGQSAWSQRISGKLDFTLHEADIIHSKFFPSYDKWELFKREQITAREAVDLKILKSEPNELMQVYVKLHLCMRIRGVSVLNLSEVTGLSRATIPKHIRRVFGVRSDFTIGEAEQIQSEFFPEIPLDELFERRCVSEEFFDVSLSELLKTIEGAESILKKLT